MEGLIFQGPRIDVVDDRMNENCDGIARESARKVDARVQEGVMALLEPPPGYSCLWDAEANESSSRAGSVALESGGSPCSEG